MLNRFSRGWYVVYVKSRCEKKVDDLLNRQQFESFLPLVKKVKKWSDRMKSVYVPLFTSYVFVYVNTQNDFSKILSIDGVCGFIRTGKKFARVKDKEINNIKTLLKGDFDQVETQNDVPTVGEIRKIQTGILNGLECEILKVDKVNKILVRINSIQMQITATVSINYLESKSVENSFINPS